MSGRRIGFVTALLCLMLLAQPAAAYLRTQTCYTPDIALPCEAEPPHCEGETAVLRTGGQTRAPVEACDYFRAVPACITPAPHCEGNEVVSLRNGRSAAPLDACVWVAERCSTEEFAQGCCTTAMATCTFEETRAACSGDTVCVDGDCVAPAGCTAGSVCLAPVPRAWCDGETLVFFEERGSCIADQCTATERREACPDGNLCRNGSCLPAGCGGPSGTSGCCSTADLQCDFTEERQDCAATGEICSAGLCEPPATCSDGEACDAPPTAPWCDGGQRVFYATTAACTNGRCVRQELRADCPGGTVCRQGACVGAGLPGAFFACPDDEQPKPVRWPTACVGYHLQLGPVRARAPLGLCEDGNYVLPDNGIRLERGWRSCEAGTVSFDCGQCTEADATPMVCVPGGCAEAVDCDAGLCAAETLGSVCDGDSLVVLERSGSCADGACETREQSRTDCAANGQWCVGGFCVAPNFSSPDTALAEAVTAGFDAWNGAAGSAWKATNLGETDEREIGIAVDEAGNPRGNVNIIVLQTASWNHSSVALGVTTPVFEAATGEIVTADMELNGVGSKRWMTGETTDPDAYDVQNVVTHEAGHFLGLDHPPCFSDGSFVPDCARATMFASSSPGERQKRELADDDIAAIAAAYPAATEPACTPPEPGFFYARTLSQRAPVASAADCPGPEAFCGGAVVTPKAPRDDCAAGGASGSWWSVAAMFGALAWMRRERGKHVA